MPGSLTAVVFDEAAARPAVGVRLQLHWVEADGDVPLKLASTNADGTTAAPLLSGPRLSAGQYRLTLFAGDYLQSTAGDGVRCFDLLSILFLVDDAAVGRQVRVSLWPDRYAVSFV